RNHLPDVDEVELLERDAVDRHDGAFDAQLLDAVDADQSADVAVTHEDERCAPLERGSEPGGDATRERIEPAEGSRLLPAIAKRDGPFSGAQIEALKRSTHGLRDAFRVDRLAFERKLGCDHRQIA